MKISSFFTKWSIKLVLSLLFCVSGLKAQTFYFNTTDEDFSSVNIYSGEIGGPAPSLIASILNTNSNQGVGNMVLDPLSQTLYVNRGSDIFSVGTDGFGYQVRYTLNDPSTDHTISDISVANGVLYHAEWQRNLLSDDTFTFRYDGPGGPVTMLTVDSAFADGLSSMVMAPDLQKGVFVGNFSITTNVWLSDFTFPLNLGAPADVSGVNGVGLTYSESGFAYYTDGMAVYQIDLLSEDPVSMTLVSNLQNVLPDIDSAQTAIDLDVIGNTLYILTNNGADGGLGNAGILWSYNVISGDAELVQSGLGNAVSMDVVPEPSSMALVAAGMALLFFMRRRVA